MIDDESDSDASSDCLNAGAKDNHGICEFEKTLSLCRSHLGRPDQADQHYTAVCRALYATASELHRFLNKISSANTQLRKMSENNNLEDLPGRAHPDLFSELDMSTWASLWMQCVANLRSGVTLRQIETRHSPVPIQFELTPYEMLMQDIRSKNFSLKKTTDWVNGDLPLATRTNAHKIIMDFIRSRPSLKPTSKRRLKPKLPQPKSHHEKILDEIKKPSSRALLNPAETKLRVYQPFKLGTVLDSGNSPKQNRNHSFSSPSKSKINSQLPRSNTIQPITRSRTKLGIQPTRSKTIQKVSDSASMSSNGSNPVKKKINVKALLHEDPSMDINEPLEKLNFSTPKRRSSERAVDVRDHKKGKWA